MVSDDEVLAQAPWIRKAARRGTRANRTLDSDDLAQDAYVAVLQCRARYARHVGCFTAFASRRIIGAVRDSVRTAKRCRYPRSLESLLMWEGSAASLPAALRNRYLRSLAHWAVLGQASPWLAPAWTRPREMGVSAADLDRQRLVRQLLHVLPARERVIMVGLYLEERSMGEMAQALGISASRVSQLHQRVLDRMRQRATTGAGAAST